MRDHRQSPRPSPIDRPFSLHLIVLLAVGVGLTGVPPAGAQSRGQLFVQVLDESGEPVTGMTPDQFNVEEDGVAVTVLSADPGTTPMRVALLVDNSETIGTSNAISSLRNGLMGFLEALPPQHEVGIFSIAGNVRPLRDFTTDRAELLDTADGIFTGRGGSRTIEGVMETWDRRFEDDEAWPVMVLVLTDGPETSRNVNPDEFNGFATMLVSRGATVHTVLLATQGGGVQTQISQILSQNTGGSFTSIVAPTGLVDALTDLATRMGAHFDDMSTRYRVVYERPTDAPGAQITAGVVGPNYRMRLSLDRRMPPP